LHSSADAAFALGLAGISISARHVSASPWRSATELATGRDEKVDQRGVASLPVRVAATPEVAAVEAFDIYRSRDDRIDLASIIKDLRRFRSINVQSRVEVRWRSAANPRGERAGGAWQAEQEDKVACLVSLAGERIRRTRSRTARDVPRTERVQRLVQAIKARRG